MNIKELNNYLQSLLWEIIPKESRPLLLSVVAIELRSSGNHRQG